MSDESSQVDDLLRRAAEGDDSAPADLICLYRKRLLRMIGLRLDRRLLGRIEPEDVLQEVYLDLARELPKYVAKSSMPLFLWLRLVAGDRLNQIHRQHLDTAMRDAGREVHLGQSPESSSITLAACLVGRLTTGSQAALRAERQFQVQSALETMDSIDREVIALRHFEGLGNNEVSAILGLSRAAASNRYVRAMGRLQEALLCIPGLIDRD